MGLLGCTAVTSGRSGCVGMDEAESCRLLRPHTRQQMQHSARAAGSSRERMGQGDGTAAPPKIPSSKLEYFFPPVTSIKHYRRDLCLYFGEAIGFFFKVNMLYESGEIR